MGPERDAEMSVLSRQQCLARLSSTRLGRIGVSIDALPVILPVHYTLADEAVHFRTTLGTKLDSAAASAVVAFQVDAYDSAERGWWSVLVQGIASPMADSDVGIGRGGTQTSDDWSSVGIESRLLRLPSDTMSGQMYRGAAYQSQA